MRRLTKPGGVRGASGRKPAGIAGSAAQKRRAAALRLIEGDCVLNIMCGKLIRRALIEREHIRLVSGREDGGGCTV